MPIQNVRGPHFVLMQAPPKRRARVSVMGTLLLANVPWLVGTDAWWLPALVLLLFGLAHWVQRRVVDARPPALALLAAILVAKGVPWAIAFGRGLDAHPGRVGPFLAPAFLLALDVLEFLEDVLAYLMFRAAQRQAARANAILVYRR